MRRSIQVALPAGIVSIAVVVGLLGQHATGQQEQKKKAQGERVRRAVAVLIPTDGSKVAGTIYFTQRRDEIEVSGRITGLTPGKHGFHVHQYGDVTDLQAGKSAGDHFNPTEMPHGRPDAHERHAGDLGNIEANQNGVAEVNIRDSILKLNGAQSIIGRGLVVHAKADEFTQPSGDAGDRVALGVIGIAQPQRRPE